MGTEHQSLKEEYKINQQKKSSNFFNEVFYLIMVNVLKNQLQILNKLINYVKKFINRFDKGSKSDDIFLNNNDDDDSNDLLSDSVI